MTSDFQNYDYIRFSVADMHGRSTGKVVPARHAQKCVESGVSLFGGTLLMNLRHDIVPVSKDDPNSDKAPRAIMKPDMETIYSVGWCGGGNYTVADVICESYWLKDKTPQEACPRYVARQQLQRLVEHGLNLFSGFEIEFILNKDQTSSEMSYMSQREQSKHNDFFFEVEHHMQRAGVDIASFHSEMSPETFEVALAPVWGIGGADACYKFKNSLQEIADKNNHSISYCNNNIAMQFSHSLWTVANENNAFNDKEGLSEIGKHWLGGLLKHAKALTALFAPTIRCYERFHQPHRPGIVIWDYEERSACVRIKLAEVKNGIYLENRIPSPMSNPYLVLAATVAAGLDGVFRKIDCPSQGEKMKTEKLPETLPKALQELLADMEMVECLGKEFVDWFAMTIESDITSGKE